MDGLRRRYRPSDDPEVRKEREERVTAWVVNPIVEHEADSHASPSFTDLFVDLFVVACLTTWSSNVRGTSSQYAAVSALSFFILLWWTWLTSVVYDCRFRGEDVVGLVAKLCLCGVYALLAGYSTSFDITTLGVPDVKVLLQEGVNGYEIANQISQSQSWEGLTAAFSIAKLVNFLQWSWAAGWAWRTGKRMQLSVMLPAVASLATGAVWIGVHFDSKDNANSSDAVRYSLCYGAIALEMVVSLVAARLRGVNINVMLKTERIALLTLIILGEGAIGIASAIASTLAGLGFNASSYGQVVLAVATLAFTFFLVFNGAESASKTMSPFRAQVYALVHFLLHAAILLATEALAAGLLYASLNVASTRLLDQLSDVINASNLTQIPDDVNEHLAKDLLRIGIAWQPEAQKLEQLLEAANAPGLNDTSPAVVAFGNEIYSFFAEVFEKLYSSYGIYPSAEAQQTIDETFPANATSDQSIILQRFYSTTNDLSVTSLEPTLQLLPAAGGILVVTVVLSLIRRKPRDAWEWTELLPRTLIGLALIALGAATDVGNIHNGLVEDGDGYAQLSPAPLIYLITDASWLLPAAAIAYGLLIGIEASLAWLIRRQQRRRPIDGVAISLEHLAPSPPEQEKHSFELGVRSSAPVPTLDRSRSAHY